MVKGWSLFAHRFEQYYRSFDGWIPPRLRTREWMFIPFGGGRPLRHLGFDDLSSIKRNLIERTPHSVFYSTAYWRDPREYKMKDKGWLGADLIFDLDGDHLPGVVDTDFTGMLTSIREQAWKLWNDFLEPEFGFDERYLHLTFSGHRGFHLHYRDPGLAHLDGEARRELVSHIRGDGVDVISLLPRSMERDASGWAGRLKNGLRDTLRKLDTIRESNDVQSKELIANYVDSLKRSAKIRGLKITRGEKVVKDLAELVKHPVRRESLEEGNLNALGGRKGDSNFHRDAFIDILRSDAAVILGNAGETDEVVTVDCHRVIRYPTSLHGKCGLRVTSFPLSRLDPDGSDPFDPLQEAIALPMDNMMEVEILAEDINTRMASINIEGSAGDRLSLPEAAAAFVVLKGWAQLIS